MRLKTIWPLVSVGGAVLIPALLLFILPDTPLLSVKLPSSLEAVGKIVLWPKAVCLYLVGPGPNIGFSESTIHEWTPVQDFAVAIGLGLSWAFYSSIGFLSIWFQRTRGLTKAAKS